MAKASATRATLAARQRQIVARWDCAIQRPGEGVMQEVMGGDWERFKRMVDRKRRWTARETDLITISLTRVIEKSDWRRTLLPFLRELKPHAQDHLKSLVDAGANPFPAASEPRPVRIMLRRREQ